MHLFLILWIFLFTEVTTTSCTVSLIKSRGFMAEAFNLTTKEGYILNVVRASNPIIDEGRPGGLANKSVVLFVHGLFNNAKAFVAAKTIGAEPKNYGHLSAARMSREDLLELLEDDPTSNSLCLTLLNFGHECWLYDRRGTTSNSQDHTSQLDPIAGRKKQKVNPSDPFTPIKLELDKTFNAKYWNFSFDEQAEFDLPQVIDFVLEKTKRPKLSLVSYSAGGLVVLSSLSIGALSVDKLEHVMLWAPSVVMGHNKSGLIPILLPLLEPLFIPYVGPVLSTTINQLLEQLGLLFCTLEPMKTHQLCESILFNLIGGDSGDQNQLDSSFFSGAPAVISSHEVGQMAAAYKKMRMDKFDYLSPDLNRLHYGQPEPPTYNISKIAPVSMSLWQGARDILITPADAKILLDYLQFPVDFHLIGDNEPNVHFNHLSFLIHKNISRHLIIPSLKTLERATLEALPNDE